MAPQLRILAGPDLNTLTPITHLVNAGKPHEIKSDVFEGRIAVYLRGLTPENGVGGFGDTYFNSPDRVNATWSIQAQGRFLQSHSSDDILFGNVFERPLNLPWGTGALLMLLNRVDPTLEQDLGSLSKPWALSPLITTIPQIIASRQRKYPHFPSDKPIKEDIAELVDGADDYANYETVEKRRAYFRDPENRKGVNFGPELTLTVDCCHGHLSFEPAFELQLPGGIGLDLTRYWDGQKIYFVCCERRKNAPTNGEDPWGKVFWCVAVEREDEEESDDETDEEENTFSEDID